MKRVWWAVGLGALAIPIGVVSALDPPHDSTNSIDCMDCHDPHTAAGGKLNIAEENPNVCMTCHTSAGLAAAFPFVDGDQALPGVTGTTHRFDSGVSGHAEADSANTSTGSIRSTGTFTGRVEREYTVTITSSGNLGSAAYSWSDDAGGSGTGTAGTSETLSGGISARFSNGSGSPSFVSGDSWKIYVRSDLRLPDSAVPAEAALAEALDSNDKVVCSTCHNQHSQEMQPADTAAPAYSGDGTGEGRHYQRVDNDTHQMCLVCHSNRDVTSSDDGSHPVGVTIPATSDFTSPGTLPLWSGEVYCMSCHYPHFSDSGGANGGAGDGYILRDGIGDLCQECHALADTTSGSHFNTSSGALWPGGQYGSTAPAHDSSYQGYCVNCHWPHGWDDDDNADTGADYPKLWLEQYDVSDAGTDPDDAEDLCYTCHDGSPAGTDIRSEFLKGTNGTDIYHHPIMDSEQSSSSRSVECVDCHNPHQASSTDKHAGVSGVDLDGNDITAGSATLEQYELCFKCHGDTYNSSRSNTTNKRLDFATTESSYHPVVQTGRNTSANLEAQLLGGLSTSSTIDCTDCHNSEATADAEGPASNSTSSPQGPHGSTEAFILRANYNRNTSEPSAYASSDFELCFLCHDEATLVTSRDRSDGARTNFYNSDRDNLHWYHMENKEVARCVNCHYNIHSNRTASNTQYRIDGVNYTSPPDGYKTHLVNFSPNVEALDYSMPRWTLNTSTGQRNCNLSCHGRDMDENYEPPAGDETSHTY